MCSPGGATRVPRQPGGSLRSCPMPRTTAFATSLGSLSISGTVGTSMSKVLLRGGHSHQPLRVEQRNHANGPCQSIQADCRGDRSARLT